MHIGGVSVATEAKEISGVIEMQKSFHAHRCDLNCAAGPREIWARAKSGSPIR